LRTLIIQSFFPMKNVLYAKNSEGMEFYLVDKLKHDIIVVISYKCNTWCHITAQGRHQERKLKWRTLMSKLWLSTKFNYLLILNIRIKSFQFFVDFLCVLYIIVRNNIEIMLLLVSLYRLDSFNSAYVLNEECCNRADNENYICGFV